MSRKSRFNRTVRYGKYWEPDASPFVVAPLTRASPVALAPLRVDPLRSLSDEERDLALGVLRLLDLWQVVWDGDEGTSPRGFGSHEIASRLSIRGAPARRALREVLTAMRRLGVVHFEYERGVDSDPRWWITAGGVEAASLASPGAAVG